jgi:hypothetical protein
MKKTLFVLTLSLVLASAVSAQNQWPDLKAYARIFWVSKGYSANWIGDRIKFTNAAVNERWAGLEGQLEYLDTALEGALAAYYLFDSAPPEAEAILPHSNLRLVDTQLGAAVYRGLVAVRFLNNTAAVTKYTEMLNFITDRGNVTRAEVETFYRQNVGASIAAEVDAQVVLIGQQLSSNVLADIKKIITDFFKEPSQTTYRAILTAHTRYSGTGAIVLFGTLESFNPTISRAVLYNENPAGAGQR